MSRTLVPLFLAIYALLLLRNAWLAEDAFVTLRVVDNFVNGHGMRWNISERVQTFTHPLWFFVLAAGYGLTGEVVYTTILISCTLSWIRSSTRPKLVVPDHDDHQRIAQVDSHLIHGQLLFCAHYRQ